MASVVACPSCGTKNRVPVSSSGRPRCASCKTDLPWLVDAGDTDFDAAVKTDQLVVVDLWAPWCGPCRQIAPVLEQLSRELVGKVKVVKVNVDHSPALSARFQARSIPMLVLLDHGEVIDTMVGAHPPPALRKWVTDGLAKQA
ncbi:thioredoxin [Nocardioides sp. GXZ039]|uniref:thioredoxin n=1 Tax=Nocardioides sp. GXZ039 TaxID=3136018 RepID=UPI0030F446C6